MDDGPTYSIGELAAAADVTPRTIRYYAAEGLLPAPEMRGKYAVYNEDHLNRLRLIAQLKAAYFPLSVIKERLDALDGEQVLQALVQPLPDAQGPGSAAEYIANALTQRRTPAQPGAPSAPNTPALRLSAPVEELGAGDDEALAEVEEARPLRLQEEAARYEAAPSQTEGSIPEEQRPGQDLARRRTGPPSPSVPPAQPQRDTPPALNVSPVQQEPVPARPAPPAAQAPAPAISRAAAPPPAPAPAAPGAPPPQPAAGAAPAPEEQRARGGLLGRLLPRRERAQPAPSAASETDPEHWSRVTLAPGVELHIREPAAPALRERIARLIAEARTILAD